MLSNIRRGLTKKSSTRQEFVKELTAGFIIVIILVRFTLNMTIGIRAMEIGTRYFTS